MNDELTTQSPPAPIVLKLKKYDDIILPHSSRLSTDILNDTSSSSFSPANEPPIVTTVSPTTLRVKLKKPLYNTDDDECLNTNSVETNSRPAKRSKKSSSNDNLYNNISEINNDLESSQQEMNEIKQEHCVINEQPTNSPLVLKIRRDSLTSTIGNTTAADADTNRQLLLKLKKNEYGELTTKPVPVDNIPNTFTNNEYTNGHSEGLNDSFNSPIHQENLPAIQPHITNMLSNLTDDNQWNDQPINSNHISQQTTTTTTSHVPMNTTPTTPSIMSTASETHTKELLDEALDSVKSVLMQTFKKNLEAGGDLNALKSSLGSDEVAEVFLSKLRESLKRETTTITENEQKPLEHINMNTEVRPCQPTTPSSSSLNTIISPIMNVVSPSPSSSSPLPSISTIMNKTTSSSPSTPIPTSPQPVTPSSNKRKSSNPITNPNRFDGATEEELAKRLLSDILQPNLDIVFVGINPSLYAVHKGHHYGGPGNHFWKLLHMSELIPNAFTAEDDYRMPQYGIGFTNIVQRPTKAGSDITKDEITAGAEILMQKIKMYRPKVVAFNGRGIYEVYAGNKHFHYGKQPELFPETDTHVFVMPSSSARCSQLPRAEDKLPFYVGLRKLRDFVNGTLHSLNEAEITFPDIKIKDTDDVLQKTVIRISNKPFSELAPEILKSYGDKIPSAQLVSKFKPNAITTQTMSILHTQQNGNLLNYDQQGSISNEILTTKSSVGEHTSSNTAIPMNDTDAAVLAALANGAFSSSSQVRQSQTIHLSRLQQQTVSFSGSSLKSNGTSQTTCTPTTSHTIHHLPQNSSSEQLTQPITSSIPILSTNSQIVPHQIVVINPNERPTSSNPILNSNSLKDLLSSQQPTQKQQFVVPSIPASVQTSNTNLPRAAITTNKLSTATADDSLYLHYEREQPSTQSPFHFSFVIDEYSSTPKRSRYVSINDL
ncbi:unnamed protein product [Adineta ricciae]|uniref:G/T mismatch-specific thymine DNA glycosylase n=1 Tax=Adineta ricciae TaxID=249248 RepID=A0A814I2D6_ADIRI|nr:unnamed protein product [Adineta ricciae]CAF1116062.1 unnamed protein product [Adineta ricciae]